MKTKTSNKEKNSKSQESDVTHSALLNIVDSDIATIEALHDLLLDVHGYSSDYTALKRARELTAKMYSSLYPNIKK